MGGSPTELEEEFSTEIFKGLPKNKTPPVMICIILNMSLIDI